MATPLWFEPSLTATFEAMATHYDTTILPTRPRKPRDKAKVEGAVLIVERWILARLRNQQFFSIEALNNTIAELLVVLNNKQMRRIGRSRKELFEEIERPALRLLPDTPFEYAEWKRAKVHPDYHVEILRGFYSVPHKLIGRQVDVRLTHRIIEIFCNHERVAVHQRRRDRGGHSTITQYMPKAHQRHAGMTHQTLVAQAARVGYHTALLVERLMRDRATPRAGFPLGTGGFEPTTPVRNRQTGSSLSKGSDMRDGQIQIRSIHPGIRSQQGTRAPGTRTSSTEPRQYPRRNLLPVINKHQNRRERMLTHPTLNQMAALGMTGMAQAWKSLNEQDPGQSLDRNEWLGLMLDQEAASRADKRFANRLRNAKMRFPDACIEDISFAANRGLDQRKILSLAQGDWIKAHEQIILTGQTGTGKTWLACAFGHQSARLDYSVFYVRVPRLFEDMAMARLDGRFPRMVDKLARVQLLILDDWGTHSLTDQRRLDLLELFEERYQRKSTIITAQLPVSAWHEMIGEPTIADAILDRIIHNAHRIELKGDSMRRSENNQDLTKQTEQETVNPQT